MAPFDQITIRLPAERRLQPVVREAVLHALQGSSMPHDAASRFATSVGRRFMEFVPPARKGSRRSLDLSIAIFESRLLVKIVPHGGGREVVVRASLRRPPRSGRASAGRRTARSSRRFV